MVETAIVMPLMLLIMTGMVSFGVALHNFVVLTNGVNTGAQLLAISRGRPRTRALRPPRRSKRGPQPQFAVLALTFVINGVSYTAPTTTSCTGASVKYGAGRAGPGHGHLSLYFGYLRDE